MAKLRQRPDGGYFYTPNLGYGVVTRQLRREGVEYLLARGVRVGDEISVSYRRFVEHNQLCYTKGEQSREDFEYLEASDEFYPSVDRELTLFMTGDSSEVMQLLLRYPLMAAEDFAKLQPNCGVSCEGLDRSVGLLTFDAYELAVQPREDRYEVTTYGDWGSIPTQPWTCGAAGLAADGEVFALRQGEWRRLSNGSRLVWEEPIRIVRKATSQISCAQIRDSATRLGQLGGDWIVERSKLPAKRNQETESWLEERGIGVFYTSPKITFLSMPSAVDEEQSPRFDGEVMVLINEISSFRNSKVEVQSAKGDAVTHSLILKTSTQLILRIPELKSGEYVLRVTTDHLVSRKFLVGSNNARTEFPDFVRIRIGSNEYCGSDATGRNTYELASWNDSPIVEIKTARSVSWRWLGAEGLRPGSGDVLDLAAKRISQDIELIRTIPGSNASLVLEAGAFGTITVEVSGLETSKDTSELLPGHRGDYRHVQTLRLRWLESVINKEYGASGLQAQENRRGYAMNLHREWIRRLSGNIGERGRQG